MTRSTFNDFVFELVRFKAEKGHYRVPVKKGGVLGKWVDKIRKEYKKLKPVKRNVPDEKQQQQLINRTIAIKIFETAKKIHEMYRIFKP